MLRFEAEGHPPGTLPRLSSSAADHRPPLYLGIDLGGTNIKSGIVDDRGCPLSSISLPTLAASGPEAGLAQLAEAGRRAVAAQRPELGRRGRRRSRFAWDAGHSRRNLDRPSQPARLERPAHSATAVRPARQADRASERCERRRIRRILGRCGRNSRSLVLFTLGTGVGSGVVADGRIIEGRHSHGAECGHIIIQMENGRPCPCGGFGHLEAYASASALVQRALEALEFTPESTLLRREGRRPADQPDHRRGRRGGRPPRAPTDARRPPAAWPSGR